MKNLAIIPVLALSTACIKSKNNQWSQLPVPEVSVSSLKESSFTVISEPLIHAPFSSTKDITNVIELKSISKKELLRMKVKLAHSMFKNGRYDFVKTTVLGTPILSLNKEDRLNLEEQLSSLKKSGIELDEQDGSINFKVQTTNKNLRLEFYMITADGRDMKRILDYTFLSLAQNISVLHSEGLNSRYITHELAKGGMIIAVPTELKHRYNMFTSDGLSLSAFDIDPYAPVPVSLKKIDAGSVVRGHDSIDKLFNLESDAQKMWVFNRVGDDHFVFFQDLGMNQDGKNLIARNSQFISGAQEKAISFYSEFKIDDKLELVIKNISRQKMQFLEGPIANMNGNIDSAPCAGRVNEFVGWKDFPLTLGNYSEQLNLEFWFRGRKLNLRPLVLFHYENGVKTNVVKELHYEMAYNEEMVQNQSLLDIVTVDRSLKQLMKYTGCAPQRYPQLYSDNEVYTVYQKATFDYEIYLNQE